MKALTVCNPYPNYILDPVAELPRGIERKRVENRTYRFLYRGPLLIHAGLNKKWLANVPPSQRPARMVWGAIVGVVDVVGCAVFNPSQDGYVNIVNFRDTQWPWLPTHQHASGPFCIVLENPRKFISAIPYKGAQGLFNVPDEVVAEQMRKVMEGSMASIPAPEMPIQSA